MKKIYYALLAVLVVAVGCSKAPIEDGNLGGVIDGSKFVITASTSTDDSQDVSNNAQTRVGLEDMLDSGEDKIVVTWEKSDVEGGYTDSFTVYDGAGDFVDNFTYNGVNGAKSGLFVQVGDTKLNSGKYTAVFPATTKESCPDLAAWRAKELEITTQTQNNAMGHLNTAVRMEGSFTYDAYSNTITESLVFKHTLSVVTLDFGVDTGTTPKSVVFKNGTDPEYTLNFATTVTPESGTYTAYFMVKPYNLGERALDFAITQSDGEVIYLNATTSKAYKAGERYTAEISGIEGVIRIYTPEEFAKIGVDVNYPLKGNYLLMNEIDLGGITKEWTPIGPRSDGFSGTFDGGGHKIKGLYINKSGDNYQGLFGYVTRGTIKNVVVVNPNVTGNQLVGAIIGHAYMSTIDNCHIKEGGSVTGYGQDTGGISGSISSDSKVLFCSNSANIKSSSTDVGGIAGGVSYSVVVASQNTGDVESTGNKNNVAGIAGGVDYGYIYGCYSTGKVVTTNTGKGGIMGNNYYGTVIGSYFLQTESLNADLISGYKGLGVPNLNTANVIEDLHYGVYQYDGTSLFAGGQLAYGYQIGAIYPEPVANVEYSSVPQYEKDTDGYLLIRNLNQLKYIILNDESVKYRLAGNIDLGDGVSEWKPLGSSVQNAFSGEFDGAGNKISGLYINQGSGDYQGLFGGIENAKITNLIIEEPDITGSDYVGALAGTSSNSTIENCSVVGGSITGNGENVGGIIGYFSSSTQAVIACQNSANVTGEDYVGGIVGYAFGVVSGCYNTGRVISLGSYKGGIVGEGGANGSYFLQNESINSDLKSRVNGVGVADLNSDEVIKVLNATICSYGNGALYDNGTLRSGYRKSVVYPEVVDNLPYTTIAATEKEGDYLLIKNVDHLRYMVLNDKSVKYRLANNIVLEGAANEWLALGTNWNNCFKGELDGDDCEISGLYINQSANVQGLFGYTNGAIISDLVINSPDITGSNYVGALVGQASRSLFKNCVIKGGKVKGDDYVGGLFGFVLQTEVFGCSNSSSVDGKNGAGGIVGYVQSSEIIASQNNGNISVTDRNAGGIVGSLTNHTPMITGCYSSGVIAYTGSDSGQGLNGIVGFISSGAEVYVKNNYFLQTDKINTTLPTGTEGKADLNTSEVINALNKAVYDYNSNSLFDSATNTLKYGFSLGTASSVPALLPVIGENVSYPPL